MYWNVWFKKGADSVKLFVPTKSVYIARILVAEIYGKKPKYMCKGEAIWEQE